MIRWAFNFTKWNPTHSEMLQAISCVQQEEKDRLARFVFKNDLKASLIGRLMMRKFVNKLTKIPYDQIKLIRNDKGKPLLDNKIDLKINFNVSHQGDFVVLVGGLGDMLLGVDVMKTENPRVENLATYFRTMSRIFTKNEWEMIRNCGDDEKAQLGMFHRLWCLKESYLKAVGVGVSVNARNVSFQIKTLDLYSNKVICDTEGYFEGAKLEQWEFQEMLLDDDHCVAVAISEKNAERIGFSEVEFNFLMENSAPLLPPDEEYCRLFFNKLDR